MVTIIIRKYCQLSISAPPDLDIVQFLRHIIVCKKWYDEECKKEKEDRATTVWRQKTFEICSSSVKVPNSFL